MHCFDDECEPEVLGKRVHQIVLGTGRTVRTDDIGGRAVPRHDAQLTLYYDRVYADLKGDAIPTWTSTSDSIPDAVVPHFAALMAEMGVVTYAVSEPRYLRILTAASNARGHIKRLVRAKNESQGEPVDF